MTDTPNTPNRRNFLMTGLAASTLATIGKSPSLFASNVEGSDRLRVGLIGCGGRGTAAAVQCCNAAPNVELYATADFFADKVEGARKKFKEGWGNHKPLGKKMNVTREREFTGFDAYKELLATDIDAVIIATQPGFRPLHYDAAVKAGKHVFMEKPVAVDPVGVRKVIESSKIAKQKGLSVVAGTQRRHMPSYLETMERIRNGEIGELRGGDCYWNWGRKIGQNAQNPKWSEMEFQIRNWYFHCWGSGDCLVEQAIHQIDVMNWAFGGPPVSALGMGGIMIEHEFGNIYDHFAIVYEYESGARVTAMASQIPGSSTRIGQNIVGSRGSSNGESISGKKSWKYKGPAVDGQEQEHVDFINSIRGSGKYLNHGKRIAESTLTAIIGRMSAYTGRELRFDWALNRSQLDLTPAKWEKGPNEIPARPIPGQEPLV